MDEKMEDILQNLNLVFLPLLYPSDVCKLMSVNPLFRNLMKSLLPTYRKLIKEQRTINPVEKTFENMILREFLRGSKSIVVELTYLYTDDEYTKIFSVDFDERICEVIPRLLVDEITFSDLTRHDTVFGVRFVRMKKVVEMESKFRFNVAVSCNTQSIGDVAVEMHLNSTWSSLLKLIAEEYAIEEKNANVSCLYANPFMICHILSFIDFEGSFILNNLSPIDFSSCDDVRPSSAIISYFSIEGEDENEYEESDKSISISPATEFIYI